MSDNQLIDDCFLHDKDRLRHDDALSLLRARLNCIVDVEQVSLANALGRVLAEDVSAPHNVPLHTNAAVDGYAFKHSELHSNPLPLSGRIAAGDLSPSPLADGTAVRIFTGAPMPEGAETVAMQEDCTEVDGTVLLPAQLKSGANCRMAGEDLKSGNSVLKAGTRLNPADIAALASVGVGTVTVRRKLKIALLASGNELRQPGDTKLKTGEVFDTNTPMLQALCAKLPVEITLCGVVTDTQDATETALKDAAEDHDVIISTGGASRGSEDHMLSTLDKLGKRHLWQLAVKPGRPMMFGQISRGASKDCIFFGLPGNPVAAMVCFLLYTRPALLALAGANWETPTRFPVSASFAIPKKKTDRREFLRGILNTSNDGTLSVRKFERDGSGLISSLKEADGLIEIPEDISELAEGETVSFIPFNAFD